MEAIKLSNGEKKIKLYVLRYRHSGHYYVGTAEDFDKRMLIHWRRESNSIKRLPNWSFRNRLKEGFIFFWFDIAESGVSQSCADLCENQLAKLIAKKIGCINDKNFIKEVHVGNNKFIDGETDVICNNFDVDNNELNNIDKEIMNYFKNPEPLKTKKGEFQIKCYNFGFVGEYDCSQCNKEWKEVASIKHPIDNEKADFFDILIADDVFENR